MTPYELLKQVQMRTDLESIIMVVKTKDGDFKPVNTDMSNADIAIMAAVINKVLDHSLFPHVPSPPPARKTNLILPGKLRPVS